MQLFRVLRLLWMLRAFLGSTGEEARWGRAAETVLTSQRRVCAPVWGTLRSKEPEEGSLRALCASRTEAGGGEGSWVPGAALPQRLSRFARVRVHQLDGITSFWKSALPTWAQVSEPPSSCCSCAPSSDASSILDSPSLCARLPGHFSAVCLLATPWTVARRAPLSMGFPRQEYWSGLPFPSPGDLPNAGIEPTPPASPALQADSLPPPSLPLLLPTHPPEGPASALGTPPFSGASPLLVTVAPPPALPLTLPP